MVHEGIIYATAKLISTDEWKTPTNAHANKICIARKKPFFFSSPIAHIIIATPTAPPTTANISRPNPIDLGANPVCNPGLLPVVPLAAPTPAVPLGTDTSATLAGTTVTAVTVLLLPSGSVVVRREVVVCDCRADVVVADTESEVLPSGAIVFEPPPTVVTMVTPWALTLVTTSPELNVPVVRAP